MKVIILTLSITFFLKVNLFAQQHKKVPINYLGIGIGLSLDAIKDTNFSPLNQKGKSLFYSIFYERYSKNIMKINIKYGDGILKSGLLDKLNTSYYTGSIGITYLKSVSSNPETTNFFIGASYKLNILYMDWYDQSAFSYNASHGLALSTALSKQLTLNQYIETNVSIPLVQFLSRPPYNGINEFIINNQDDPINIIFNSELTSFKAFKAIHWNVNYRHKISSKLNYKIDYDLHIQKIKTVNEFRGLSNRISTSILYNF